MGRFTSVGKILQDFDYNRDRFIAYEFQKYGYDLARELGDLEHKALYIMFAKRLPRKILEEARRFVKEAYNVKSRPRLFMWKLKEMLREQGLKMPRVRKKRGGRSSKD